MIQWNVEHVGTVVGISREIEVESLRDAEVAVMRAATAVQRNIRTLLRGQRSGRVYRVPGTSRTYTASAPGEPPARLFGQLANSIAVDGPRRRAGTVEASVGTPLQKARRLEFGGSDSRGVYIAPRPYIRPGVQRSRAEIDAIFAKLGRKR